MLRDRARTFENGVALIGGNTMWKDMWVGVEALRSRGKGSWRVRVSMLLVVGQGVMRRWMLDGLGRRILSCKGIIRGQRLRALRITPNLRWWLWLRLLSLIIKETTTWLPDLCLVIILRLLLHLVLIILLLLLKLLLLLLDSQHIWHRPCKLALLLLKIANLWMLSALFFNLKPRKLLLHI